MKPKWIIVTPRSNMWVSLWAKGTQAHTGTQGDQAHGCEPRLQGFLESAGRGKEQVLPVSEVLKAPCFGAPSSISGRE